MQKKAFPKMEKLLQNGEISKELGEIQGEFCETKDREYIDKMCLMLYQVIGRLQAMVGTLGWEIIPPKIGKSPQNGKITSKWENRLKMGRSQWNWVGFKGNSINPSAQNSLRMYF